MESYEENRVKWLIDKPGGLFLARRRRSLRRAGHYSSGLKKPRKAQLERIVAGLHKLGRDLLAVS